LIAGILIAAASLHFIDLFRELLGQRDPFASAQRLCDRAFGAREGEWRRYETDHGFVELGPFEQSRPRKIVIDARFESRDDAIAYARQVWALLPLTAQPRMPPDADSYRGSVLIGRKLIGVELERAECGVIVTLIAGGPRTIVEN
jgi:hypothetical protein